MENWLIYGWLFSDLFACDSGWCPFANNNKCQCLTLSRRCEPSVAHGKKQLNTSSLFQSNELIFLKVLVEWVKFLFIGETSINSVLRCYNWLEEGKRIPYTYRIRKNYVHVWSLWIVIALNVSKTYCIRNISL